MPKQLLDPLLGQLALGTIPQSLPSQELNSGLQTTPHALTTTPKKWPNGSL
ncbi:hypothetical protein DSO57_1036565 [Entomophthora muscae]|uniref:Uncharacterized protein n=1 Tax=Entomophthora muscae TaxID=34485 RepID=A0ACC2RQ48_9FUNG|nr:hypothetical protein DSO57_1036565 [Entomophthora muscae]